MLVRTRYPANLSFGFDGTSYYFLAWVSGHGTIEGKAWSPRDSSATHHLVQVTQGLSAMLTEPGQTEEYEQDVMTALASLEAQLDQMHANEPFDIDQYCADQGY